MLVEREAAHRDGRRLTRLLAKARLNTARPAWRIWIPAPAAAWTLDSLPASATVEWIERGQPVLIAGPTGWARHGLPVRLRRKPVAAVNSALYSRLPRLLEELRIARGEGTTNAA